MAGKVQPVDNGCLKRAAVDVDSWKSAAVDADL